MIRTARATHADKVLAGLEFAVNDYESMAFSEEFDAVLFFDSLHRRRAFNGNEKEMPPYRVARLARDAGFSRTRTYAHQGQVFTLVNQEPSASSGHTGLRRVVLGSRALRPVLAFLLMAFLKRWSGVMVLTK